MPLLSTDLTFRGLVNQTTSPDLLSSLETTPVTFYAGFDPTASSLHVGSLLLLTMMRRLQEAGHRAIGLAGGATGMIGDPGGKVDERQLLSIEQIEAHVAGIAAQLAKFVDLDGGERGFVLNNATWLASMNVPTYLRDVGKHFTVNEMVAKDSVRARFERPDAGISYTEFSYMLLQAYDFLHLHRTYGCGLQLGGSDQWGNITMGVSLVRKVAGARVEGMTIPLVTKADGTKFGKSESGAVWLDPALTSPYRFFQFFLQADDAVVGTYLRYFTFFDHEEIEALEQATIDAPARREAQRRLAHAVTAMVHGDDEATRAERAGAALFSGDLASLDASLLRDVVEDAPSTAIDAGRLGSRISVIDAAVEGGLFSSKGEARRAIDQGGLYVNDVRVDDLDAAVGPDDLLFGTWIVLRRGKKQLHVLAVR